MDRVSRVVGKHIFYPCVDTVIRSRVGRSSCGEGQRIHLESDSTVVRDFEPSTTLGGV